MKPNKRLAAVVAGALAVAGVAAVSVASPASATTTITNTGTQLFAQINSNGLSGVQNLQPTGAGGGAGPNAAGHNITITVSPSTGPISPGTPITVTVSSSTLTLCNGPAAAITPNQEELDAIIVINGTNYLLRGPQNSIAVPASTFNNSNHSACAHPVFNSGWTVSSAAGGSSATSDTTATAATTGLGTALLSTPGTITSLTAPNTAGTFNVSLASLALNTISGTGATAGVNDAFDEFINLDNGGHDAAGGGPSYCDNSATCAGFAGPGGIAGDAADSPNGVGSGLSLDPGMFISAASATPPAPTTANYLSSTVNNPTARDISLPASTNWNPVTLDVVNLPTSTITSVTNTGTDGLLGGTGTAADTPIPLGAGGVPYFRASDALTVTGNNGWPDSVPAADMAFNLCPAAATAPGNTSQGCNPISIGNAWLTIPVGTLGTSATGQLNPVTIQPGSSVASYSGSYQIWLVACSAACSGSNTLAETTMPVQLLGTRSLSTTATTVNPGTSYAVTGSNWYPGETVTVKGGQANSPITQTITNSTAKTNTTGVPTVTLTMSAQTTLVKGDYVTVAGTTNGGGVNISNAELTAVTTTSPYTISYVDPSLSGPPSTTIITSAADTGTVAIDPGTESPNDAGTTIVASSTGTLTGTASTLGPWTVGTAPNTTTYTPDEFYAMGLQNSGAVGTVAQNYAESNQFTLATDACTAVANGNYSNNTAVGGQGGATNPQPYGLFGEGSCNTSQTLSAKVTAGTLSQQATATGSNPNDTTVTLGTDSTPLSGATLQQPFNSLTVTDTRGGSYGWSLVANTPPFTTPVGGLTISNTDLSTLGSGTGALSCVVNPTQANPGDSAPAGITGGAQTFGSQVNLCTKAANTVNSTTQSTAGQWIVSGYLSLAVPAFQAAGSYSTIMTVTLS